METPAKNFKFDRISVGRFTAQSTAATVGLFAAPLVPTAAPAFYASTTSLDAISAFYGALLVYVLSLLLGGLIGLPLLYFFGRIRWVNVWVCLLGGFFIGALSGALMILLVGVGSDAVLIYGCQGAGAGAVFWGLWRLGPDPSAAFASGWVQELVGTR